MRNGCRDDLAVCPTGWCVYGYVAFGALDKRQCRRVAALMSQPKRIIALAPAHLRVGRSVRQTRVRIILIQRAYFVAAFAAPKNLRGRPSAGETRFARSPCERAKITCCTCSPTWLSSFASLRRVRVVCGQEEQCIFMCGRWPHVCTRTW